MRIPEFWRTSRFRQTLIYGTMFACILLGMLGFIYEQTAGYLGRQVDTILRVEATALVRVDAETLPERIDQEIERDPRHVDLYGLFSRDGTWITGNVRRLPAIPLDGSPHELVPGGDFAPDARALAVRLPWGEVMVVGRDITQLAEFRRIILKALVWSAALVIVIGLGLGVVLSLQPLRRIREVRAASNRIMLGDLGARLPMAGRHDELDMLAAIVNAMMDEIERLVREAKSVGDVVAHDLRTPLTRLRLMLYRLNHDARLSGEHGELLDQALRDADTLLSRFRAILRISEIENQSRRAGFETVDLESILDQAEELYGPLAEDHRLVLTKRVSTEGAIHADPELMFEAVGNLIDNAIKFTPSGGRICLVLSPTARGPELHVVDNGPGVPPEERKAVLQRFYRASRDQPSPGSGLGLSVVAAIAHLHGFGLSLEDASPGLRVVLKCWPRALEF